MFIKSGILAAALLAGSGALALPNQDTTAATERVTYDDLDLSSASGDAALLVRIRAAANRVCDFGGMQSMDDFVKSGRCYRSAVRDGQHQMNQLIADRSIAPALAATALIITAK